MFTSSGGRAGRKLPKFDGLTARADAIASATTTHIWACNGDFVHVTGTTTIASFGTCDAGILRQLVFDGALTLTHNATSLILPGGANITTAAGDTAIFRSEGSGNWRCVSYQKASGTAVVATGSALVLITETTASGGSYPNFSFTSIPATYRDLEVRVRGRGQKTAGGATLVGIRMRFNGDTGNNYDFVEWEAVGSGTSASGSLAGVSYVSLGFLAAANAPSNVADLLVATVGDYRGTTFQKAVAGQGSTKSSTATTGLYAMTTSGWWRSTAAITQIDVFPEANNFVDGTICSLYGRM